MQNLYNNLSETERLEWLEAAFEQDDINELLTVTGEIK